MSRCQASGVFGAAQIVVRFFDPLPHLSGHITQLGHKGRVLRAPQAVRPIQPADRPAQTPPESQWLEQEGMLYSRPC